MPAHKPRPPEPTHEQLALAYRHLARPGWPPTLDAALASHTHAVCIRGLARQLGRAPACVPAGTSEARRAAAAYVPPTPAAQRVIASYARRAGGHDPRRLASGDRDDD